MFVIPAAATLAQMNNMWRRMSAMPYTSEDFTHLGHVFVSHARFLTAGRGLGGAIVAVNQWGTAKQLAHVAAKEDIVKMQTDIGLIKKHLKIE